MFERISASEYLCPNFEYVGIMRRYFSKQFVRPVVPDNFIFIRLLKGCVMTPIDEIAAPQFLPTFNKRIS